MAKISEQTVLARIQALLLQDTQQTTPVAQSVSLFFWQKMEQWLHQLAHCSTPFIIVLAGPSGSGKSFIREKIVAQLSQVSSVSDFTQDNYYRNFDEDFPHLSLSRFYNEINFDDPAHIRFHRLQRDLRKLKTQPPGSNLKIPRLCFGTPTQKPTILEEDILLNVSPFVVTEGIHAFYDPMLLPFYDFKIYVDVDEHLRRKRWLARNHRENRGVTDNMWRTTVQCLQQHILPTRTVADLVINNNAPQDQTACFIDNLIKIMGAVRMSHSCQETA